LHAAYSYHYLPNGIRLVFLPTKKFKTISAGLFVHQELSREFAAKNALLPAVLEQGSRQFPDYLTIQRELEYLYGAGFSSDIIKSGERHILAFTLETAHGHYLGENGTVLNRSLSILGSVIGDPLIVNGAFREEYVNQEKNQLKKEIKALLNDKIAYAHERCLNLMCSEERFGVYKLGRLEDYDKINASDLYSYYREILRQNPIDLYIIGDLEAGQVLEAAGEAFKLSRRANTDSLPGTEIVQPVEEVKHYTEEMNVNQTKLVLGFRTYTGFQDVLHCPLLVYSGILGGFPHSKLFTKVREEANLAYYIMSRLERHKGLMLISAGINDDDYKKAREIIDQQVADMVLGNISDVELENTKRGLINQLKSKQDNPNQIISFHLDGSVGGKIYTIDEMVAGIEAVDREKIVEVARRVELDTVYLLRPGEGGDQENGR